VIDRLLQLEKEGPRCIFLRGNHEDMFLDFLGLGGHAGDSFLYNGGGATLQSYGLHSLTPEAPTFLPPGHLDFFRRLRPYFREGDFLFVHAGIRPGLSLEEQCEEDLFWIRDEFIAYRHDLGCTVVFGHTPRREVLVHLPYKIGLDTGLVYGNKLSCLEVDTQTLFQVRRGESRVEERPLPLSTR
jgi:serine/threonine protein phosphatase 1